jgi:hypothetical protein
MCLIDLMNQREAASKPRPSGLPALPPGYVFERPAGGYVEPVRQVRSAVEARNVL